MKKTTLLLLGALFWLASGKALDASLSYATFKSPSRNYVEIYLHFMGKSITYQPANDSLFQAQVDVLMVFLQDEEIVKADRFILSSPLRKKPVDLVDVKRYGLDNGTYTLEVTVTDKNQPDNSKSYKMEVSIDFSTSDVQLSDIQLLAAVRKAESESNLTKNGLFMEPLPFHFYGRHATTLAFYAEVYNTDTNLGDDFQLTYSIQDAQDSRLKSMLIGHKRMKPGSIVPILIQADISEVPSGNYNLVVEIRDRNQQLIAEQTLFFQRSNPNLDIDLLDTAKLDISQEFVQQLSGDELAYCLKAIYPLLDDHDNVYVNGLMREGTPEAKRLFVYTFFARENAASPATAYQEYMDMAKKVDDMFYSGFRRGFETDRGYIFLKYGPPNDIEHREEEPSAPPYQVWVYYAFPATGKNNVKFIFYTPSLAPGDFQRLHSTAIGELRNPNWQMFLYKNSPTEFDGATIDNPNVGDNFNRNAVRVFTDY